jgi:dihydroorotase-like cyclic amidohydrolase
VKILPGYGLDQRRKIQKGYDADLVVWDPDELCCD